MLCMAAMSQSRAAPEPGPDGSNLNPVQLHRPPVAPLSAVAQIGRAIFHDRSLSASGRQSCASCHSPDHAYGPPDDADVALGGATLNIPGVRAVPSLMYLEREPAFSIGPDAGEVEDTSLAQKVSLAKGAARATKIADTAAASANLVPQGGLFWDGRADTLQKQALVPLLNPLEMANRSEAEVAAKLRAAPYTAQLVQIFGPTVLKQPGLLLAEAMFAVARYQFEDASFHPYSSKFDAWLEGHAKLSAAELRGWRLFNDPARANCAGCHVDQVTDSRPPLFTDHQFEALGAPRNPAILANRDPHYVDLGVCGPIRTDLRAQTQYCGMFLTPTLRNSARRSVFFHNGVFHTLREVMDFYNFRDVAPDRAVPHRGGETLAVMSDLPARDRANLDRQDPPFDRHPGQAPAMSTQDEDDIIAFLHTLSDAAPADGSTGETGSVAPAGH